MITSNGPSACPRCAGELDHGREVERSIREGNDVALVRVRADVCLRCGETLLHPGMVDLLARARNLLKEGSALHAVGRVFDLRDKAA